MCFLLAICAGGWEDSMFLSASLTCSPRLFYTYLFWDLPLAPPPFASLLGAFSFTESMEAIRTYSSLTISWAHRHLYPHTHVCSSHCGKTVHFPGSGSLGQCAPSSQIFRDSSSAVIPTLQYHQLFSLRLALLPTLASCPSAMWGSKTPWRRCLLAGTIHFLRPSLIRLLLTLSLPKADPFL